MEERLRRAEEEVVRVEDEMKYFKMELRNREQNFNQVFGGGASPHPTHSLCLVDRVAIVVSVVRGLMCWCDGGGRAERGRDVCGRCGECGEGGEQDEEGCIAAAGGQTGLGAARRQRRR